MYEPLTGTFRSPGGHQATMHYRSGTNDWNTLNACMTEDEYALRGRTFTGSAIDIGGYLGGVGIGLALDNPGLSVIIVEPVPGNAELCRQNVIVNDLHPRVTVIEGAAGGKSSVDVWYGFRGTESLEHHAFVGNSTLAYDDGGQAEHDTVTYSTPWTLTALVKAAPTPVSLVKIDCEGGEWVILDSPAVAKCAEIVGEWHNVRGHTQADMLALLDKTHNVTFSGPYDGPGGFAAVLR